MPETSRSKLLFVTTADTEILAAARASERLPEGFPKLLCANPVVLEDPAAFFERELPGAGAVLHRDRAGAGDPTPRGPALARGTHVYDAVDAADRAYFEAAVEPLMAHPLIEYVGEITDACAHCGHALPADAANACHARAGSSRRILAMRGRP